MSTYTSDPPLDAAGLSFGDLLRLSMDFGLGKKAKPSEVYAVWTEDQLSSALEAEHHRVFSGRKDEKSKDNTLAAWLHKGSIPGPDNLSVLIAVLTDHERIEHAEEWRTLFRNAARTRRSRKRVGDDATAKIPSVYPRAKISGLVQKSFWETLSDLFPDAELEHLRAHLSADHALDVFERIGLPKLPDIATAEEALHHLLHRAIGSVLFGMSLEQFLKGGTDDFAFDQLGAKDLSHHIFRSSEPFTTTNLRNLSPHPLLQSVSKVCGDIAVEALERAVFREWARHHGFYVQALVVLWKGQPEEASFLAWLQLRLHQASVELEMKSSLFSSSKAGAGEPFSLNDIYIPLPCVSMEEFEQNQRAFDDNTSFLSVEETFGNFLERNWRSEDINDRVMVLRGDPGAGKTSVMKSLAWSAAVNEKLQDTAVLFVHFQKGVSFESVGRLELQSRSLKGFLSQGEAIDILSIVEAAGFSRLLVFFDGLDELGSIGAHEHQVRQFSEIVGQHLEPSCSFSCKFVISGRDQAFRPTEFDLDLFPVSYRLVGLMQERVELQRPDAYIEDSHLSHYFDLRQDWLEKFCRYKSLHGNALSAENLRSSIKGLDELSAEPLLLFLLSRLVFVMANRHKNVSFDLDGVFDISRPSGITKNDIYSLLIASIRHPQHRDPSQVDRPYRDGGLPDGKDFERILGCMAVPTWHNGTGRRGTIRAFFDQAEQRGLQAQARRFTTAAELGDTSLIDPEHLSLMSVFYFDTWDGGDEDGQEYEFTHKSFSSYLLSREIFSQAIQLAFTFQEGDDVARENALVAWIYLTCKGFEEPEILRFLNIEVDRYFNPEGVKFLGDLGEIGETAKGIRARDILVDTDDFRTPFSSMYEAGHEMLAKVVRENGFPSIPESYQRCLVVLFAVWTAFARGTQRSADESYDLELDNQEQVFRALATPIDANELDALYNVEAETSYFSESLSALNLEAQDLSGLNLINARFCNANLDNAHFQLSALDWARIEECKTEGLTFISCQMNHARFFRSHDFAFVNSVIRHGLVEYCRFNRQIFDKSELTATRWLNCRFESCEFEAVSFQDGEFTNCTFKDCLFSRCVFDEAHLDSVSFANCEFVLCSAQEAQVSETVKFSDVRENIFHYTSDS